MHVPAAPQPDDALLDELVAFAAEILPRCPPDIDPHHFGTRLAAVQYLAIAREVAAASGGHEVLDWGTGFGHVAFLLARLGATVEAYDVEPRFSAVDRRLLETPGISFRLGVQGAPLPYETGRFRTVLSVGTLEHVADEPRALDELARVTRPGGRLLIYHLPNRWSWIEAVAKRAGRYHHDRTYRPRECRELLARHGFAATRILPYHVLPRGTFSRNAALRGIAERRYRLIEGADAVLSRMPPLSLAVTAFTIHASRLAEQPG